jgi:two-component system nitrate/nitrite response regulator NarL
MDESVTRIGVVDDYPIFRDGVVYALSQESDFRVVGEGESIADAVRICDESDPHVMLIAISILGDRITAVSEVCQRYAKVGVIVLTDEDTFESVSAALGAGARGYLLKECGARELNDTIRVIAGGGTHVPTELAAGVFVGPGEASPRPAWLGTEQQGDCQGTRADGKDREVVRVDRARQARPGK